MNLQIVNMVATVRPSSPLDLGMLAKALKGSEFSPSGGRWLKMRLAPENYYTAFYKSGKFLVTGVKSLEEIESIADRVISILRNAQVDADKKEICIQNIVMMGSVKMNASWEKIILL